MEKDMITDIIIPVHYIMTEEFIISFYNEYQNIYLKYDKFDISRKEKLECIIYEIQNLYNVKITIKNIDRLVNKNIFEIAYLIYVMFMKNYKITRKNLRDKVKRIMLRKLV